jgi:hypothetical protein
MSNFLHLVRFTPKALKNKSALPLFMEFPVNLETAPFLVTSTKSVQWTMEPLKGGVVRAAVRQETTKGALFREAFESIAALGQEAQWGNVQPFTEEGLHAVIKHVTDYELTDLEILVPKVRKAPKKEAKEPEGSEEAEETEEQWEYRRPAWLDNQSLRLCPTSWLPDDSAIVVPKEREYVGFIGLVGAGIVMVVHNASRGIGILQGD